MTQDEKNKLIEEIYSKVCIPSGPSCWRWLGSAGSHGYGTIYFEGKNQKAHRISYRVFKGPIPKGMNVLHSCDNTLCVNPKHLWTGTTLDNNRDRAKKGRSFLPKGKLNPNSKLTESQILKIRSSKKTVNELAKKFKVKPNQIYNIRKNKSWTHL